MVFMALNLFWDPESCDASMLGPETILILYKCQRGIPNNWLSSDSGEIMGHACPS